MARVDRRRGHDPRGPRRPRSTSAQLEAELVEHADRPLKIGSFSAASQRHRDPQRHPGDLASCSTSTARCRSGTSPPPAPYVEIEMDRIAGPASGPRLRATRTRSSSRPTSSSAGPARPASSSPAASCSATACPTCPGGGTVAYVNPLEHVYLDRPRASRGGRHAGDRRVDPRGARLPAQGGGRRRRDPRARGVLHPAGDRALARRTRRSRSSATRRCRGCRSCRSSSATTAATSTTTSSSRCSTTCSASSRAAAARAPGRTATGCSASTSRRSHEFEREIARGCEGIKPGWVRVNFNYFISEAVFDYILRSVELVAREGWRLLPGYRFEAATGLWRHARRLAGAAAVPPRRGVRRRRRVVPVASPHPRRRGVRRTTWPRPERILADPVAALGEPPAADGTVPEVGEDFEIPALVLAPRRGPRRAPDVARCQAMVRVKPGLRAATSH